MRQLHLTEAAAALRKRAQEKRTAMERSLEYGNGQNGDPRREGQKPYRHDHYSRTNQQGRILSFEHVSQFFQPDVWYWKITTREGKVGLFMLFWGLHGCFATDDGAVIWGKWIQREEGLLIDNNLLIDAVTGEKVVPLLDSNLKLMNIKLDPKYRVKIPTFEENPGAWLPIGLTPFK